MCLLQVTDYTRDLEEMQNVSREEYLASLRRCVYALKCFLTCIHTAAYVCCVMLSAGRAVVSQEDYLNIGDSPGVNLSILFLQKLFGN